MTPAEELQSGDYEPTLQTRSPVIKTGIPPTYILTKITCFNHKEKPAFITGILFTLQLTCFQNRWFPERPLFYPVRDCSVLRKLTLCNGGDTNREVQLFPTL